MYWFMRYMTRREKRRLEEGASSHVWVCVFLEGRRGEEEKGRDMYGFAGYITEERKGETTEEKRNEAETLVGDDPQTSSEAVE